MSKQPPDPNSQIATLELVLGVQKGYIHRIFDELGEPYLTILKSCTLFETVLNQALADVSPQHWTEWVRSRHLHEKRRLAVLSGLLTPNVDKAVGALADLRNRIVHDVSGFSFSFDDYLSDPNRRNEWAGKAGWIYELAGQDLRNPSEESRRRALEDPVLTAILVGIGASLLVALSEQTQRGKAVRGLSVPGEHEDRAEDEPSS